MKRFVVTEADRKRKRKARNLRRKLARRILAKQKHDGRRAARRRAAA